MKIWRLKKGADRRLRSGHPWVFSNELMASPKGIQAGELVEVQDIKGNFLARGYGNPVSLIAFRAMSFESHNMNPCEPDYVANKLIKAWKHRFQLGFNESFRICYSEADGLPGLILDRYTTTVENKNYQIFSYQLLTSGMQKIFLTSEVREKIFKLLTEKALEWGFSTISWEQTVLLSKNDVQIRKLEGLAIEEPAVEHNVSGLDLRNCLIQVQSVSRLDKSLIFHVNLIDGQKTGFFLDQTFNMKLLVEALRPRIQSYKKSKIKIIDLCCYMGQWSMQLADFLSQNQIEAEITLVDVSEMALEFAQKNLKAYSNVKTIVLKRDVLEGLVDIPNKSYDVVISDPPAFVKNKKDLEVGLHGYMKLNQQAFRIAKNAGLVVSCTCSGLVTLPDFKNSLRKALLRSGQKGLCIAEGGLGWDHPQLLQFEEGQYLKMILHSVE